MRLTELASDLEALRTDIADELLAINRYEQQTFTLTDEEARETVARILDERKQHVALLLGAAAPARSRSSARSSTADARNHLGCPHARR